MIAVLETTIKGDLPESVTLFQVPEHASPGIILQPNEAVAIVGQVELGRDDRLRVVSDDQAKEILMAYKQAGFALNPREFRGYGSLGLKRWHTFVAVPKVAPPPAMFRMALQYPEEFKNTWGKRWFDSELQTAQGQRDGTVFGILGGGTKEAGDKRESEARRLWAMDPVEFGCHIVDHRLAIMDAIQWGRPFCIDAWERYNAVRKMTDIPEDYFRFRNQMWPRGAPPFTGKWTPVAESLPQADTPVLAGAWVKGKWRVRNALWYCRGLKPAFNGSTLFGPEVEWVPELQQHCLRDGWYRGVAYPWSEDWEPQFWQPLPPAPPSPNEIPGLPE